MKLVFILLGLISSLAQGETIKIAIVDTGIAETNPSLAPILCPTGHKDLTGYGLEDRIGHGTHIAQLIQSEGKDLDYCILIIKYFHSQEYPVPASTAVQAFYYAIEQGASIINFSSNGDDFSEAEKEAIASHQEITFYVAAGNDRRNLNTKPTYPCSYNLPNLHCVGSLNKWEKHSSFTNFGDAVTDWALGEYDFGRGTSYATPIALMKHLKEKK